MPIRDKSLYPSNWKEISLAIRERAGWRCEWCGAENYQPHPETGSKVVLTVAHYPDHNPANCAKNNLVALCQKCHNSLDAPMRAINAKVTRARKRREAAQSAGQKEMF